MTLTAKFEDQATLETVLEAISADDAVVYSAKPVEFEPGVLDRPSRISVFAFVGAVFTGVGMTTFMLWTQGDYPLITGGMPLKSLWPIGVITYEITMLGAVAGTLLAFLIEGRFFREKGAPAAALDTDGIYLCVSGSDELGEQLRSLGAVSVEKSEA